MVFLAAIAAAVAVASPSPSPSASPTALPEITHVTTSDRSEESITRSARTTYVVTSAQIKQRGDITIADALDAVPGVSIEHYGGFGAGTSISIRGSSQSQVLVMVDGLPVAGQQIGSFDLEALSTEGVERIEVVEGGGSTLYGSSSIGGVVNVITQQKSGYAGLVSLGSFGSSTYEIDTPYVTYQRSYDANGFSLPDGSTRRNADGAFSAGSFHYRHAIGEVSAAFYTDLSNEAIGVPNAEGAFSPTSRQSILNQDARLSLSYGHARSSLSLDLGASRLALNFTCDTATDANCYNSYITPLPQSYDALYSEGRSMASVRNVVGDENYRIIYGVDLTRGSGITNDGIDTPIGAAYSQTAAYVQSQWFSTNGSTVYAGLRGERDSGAGAGSPSIGGILKLSSNVEVKANASTAFRAPDLEELYYPNASNPNLAPEHTRNGDVTVVDNAILGGTSLGWFTTTGTNLITFDETANMPENVQHAAIGGLIFSAKTRPLHGYHATLDITNTYEANDAATGTRLDDRGPVFKARLGIVYQAPATSRLDSAGISATTQGQNGIITAGIPSWEQPVPFTRIDAFASYRIGAHALLTVRGLNLGNERYSLFGSYNASFAPFDLYPMPGRSFQVELRTR